MDIEVQNNDSNYQEQNTPPDKKYENTPYTGESQQDYFGNVDDTPTTSIDEDSVMSIRQQPYRPSRADVDPNFKYSVAHTTFMEQQEGANMMQTYFKIEASLLTPQYGFCQGLELFGNEGYQAALKELDKI